MCFAISLDNEYLTMHNIFIMFIILHITDFPFHQNLIRFIFPSISKYDLFFRITPLTRKMKKRSDFEFNFKERDHLDKNSLFSNVSEKRFYYHLPPRRAPSICESENKW